MCDNALALPRGAPARARALRVLREDAERERACVTTHTRHRSRCRSARAARARGEATTERVRSLDVP